MSGGRFNTTITVKHFANDPIIYCNISSDNDWVNLNRHPSKIEKWCADWQIELNMKNMNVTRKKQCL